MIDPAAVKARFPEFDSIDDSRIQIFIDDAVIILNETYWGEKYDMGLSYLTAHFLALGETTEAGSASSIAPVSARAVDGTSIAFAQMTPTNEADAMYASTIYGQRYLALRKNLGVPASVI